MCTEIKTNPSLLGSFPCFTTVCFITGPWWYEMAPQARCVNTWSLASGAVWRFYRPFRRKLVTGDSPVLLQPVLFAVCPLLPVCGHSVLHGLELLSPCPPFHSGLCLFRL